MAKQIILHEQAQQAALRGMATVAEVVGATLGPRGNTVVLGRPMVAPLVTKDGVTVASEISLPDPWENEGAKLIQQVAKKTNTEAGDGTTAATILTHAIFKEGIRQITAGANPSDVERGIRNAVDVVVRALKSLATPILQSDVERLSAVATISANGDVEMGSIIGRAISHAGVEGNYSLDEGVTDKMDLEIAEGLQLDRGLLDPAFATQPGGLAVLSPCNIFVTDRRLIDMKEAGAILQTYIEKNKTTPLLIIAEDIELGAKQLMVTNQLNPQVPLTVCPVRAPGTGPIKKQLLEDIAVMTGAKACMISAGGDPSKMKFEDLGAAARVIVTPHRTTIVGGEGAKVAVDARKDELRSVIADPETKDFDRAMAERRLAALNASVAVVKLGKAIHSKLLEKRDRAEDALNATRGALMEGIVPGGGVALVRCLPALREVMKTMDGDLKVGAGIVAAALTAPLHRIARNAGASADVVVNKVLSWETIDKLSPEQWGYNAALDKYENLVDANIVDPVKVVRLALQNASELAGLLLTSAAMVVDVPEPKPQQPLQGRPGGNL